MNNPWPLVTFFVPMIRYPRSLLASCITWMGPGMCVIAVLATPTPAPAPNWTPLLAWLAVGLAVCFVARRTDLKEEQECVIQDQWCDEVNAMTDEEVFALYSGYGYSLSKLVRKRLKRLDGAKCLSDLAARAPRSV